MKKIERRVIDWRKTGIRLRRLRTNDMRLRKYVCWSLKYDLGECEFHLAFRTDDFDAAYALHKEMGCICYENPAMGIYFIQDPDGYWLEIVPVRK